MIGVERLENQKSWAVRLIGGFAKLCFFSLLFLPATGSSEPIYHEVFYPEAQAPTPAVILLHTSGGFATVIDSVSNYTKAGYTVVAPDFFKRHSLTKSNRFETWTTYRTQIEAELIEIVAMAKKNKRIDARNIFAVGFSNGGYWATFLAARKYVNAAVSHYGVWAWPKNAGWTGYPVKYLSEDSNPVLAIHGAQDSIQKARYVFRLLDMAAEKSPKFHKHIFPEAGHSWDCVPCQYDGYDETVERQALKLTFEFLRANKR